MMAERGLAVSLYAYENYNRMTIQLKELGQCGRQDNDAPTPSAFLQHVGDSVPVTPFSHRLLS